MESSAHEEATRSALRWALLVVLSSMPAMPLRAGAPSAWLDEVVLTGLTAPTAARFASDGTIVVAEKSGRILRFDDLADTTPELLADLSSSVHDYWDRGLLGLALDPEYPKEPHLYVLYTLDAPPGGTPPTWGDTCPTPPGPTSDGCVVTGRLSRLDLDDGEEGGGAKETVLIDGAWCQQFHSHSIGTVAFGPDGALYVGAGDGAFVGGTDYGQLGGTLPGTPTPRNPCGDPPAGIGGVQVPPTAEGGALRSQDLRTAGDPTGWNGAILRLDPQTGAALADNPLFGGADSSDDPIIAFGLRNPFRFAIDPQSGEIWVGDVGKNAHEEINRIADPADAVVENFGWPCFEGAAAQPLYDTLDLDLCETLYAAPLTVTAPFFSYQHGAPPDPDRCDTGGGNSAAISALAVYTGSHYPVRLAGGLFFGDYRRSCLWAMPLGAGGLPDPAQLETIASATGALVDLVPGPDGDLFYVDIIGGSIHRIRLSPDYIFDDGFQSGDASRWSSSVP